ncbi:MAG: protease HtpX [Anaerobiospirillum succiniciproducens]|uniref:protease HtpX n=1 Tax=Anaerobiospirillum succiniciproducens TaxID=13335 RepID=UPI0023551036|nr:protease HtpX [Anaerobiospirillum succiniciproducens]MCI6863597.1 protease HtpX [Anaerobiospirillum succiniciproducens]MDY2797903.1 protease HtpX [Anaerobiospirillum succiniciproducens]
MRVLLFILMQAAVLVVVGVVGSILMSLLGIRLSPGNYAGLFVMCAIFGSVGSIVSLFMSKSMCKRAYGVEVITQPRNNAEAFLLREVSSMAQRAGIAMPEVGIYYSAEPNAFATGASKDAALVAVSSGLLNNMSADEVRGVLGHEISHISNGDMVTMTLLQGVLNTFVYFFSYIIAQALSGFLNRSSDENSSGGGNFFVFYMVNSLLQMLFGILATMISMWFSRYREYRADAGSADLEGTDRMISALQALQRMKDLNVQKEGQFSALCINGGVSVSELFMSHPPLEKRIAALRARGR